MIEHLCQAGAVGFGVILLAALSHDLGARLWRR